MKLELQINNKNIYRGKVLFSWIRITFIVTLLCLVIIMLSYTVTERLIKEQISAINSGLTAQNQSRIDNEFIEIQSIGVEISEAAFTAAVLGSSIENLPVIAYAYRDMVDYFRVTRATHTYIKEICLIRPAEDLMINEDGIIKWSESGFSDLTKNLLLKYCEDLIEEPVWNRIGWKTDPEKTCFIFRP